MNGVCDLVTDDELGSLRTATRLLTYLPDNNRTLAPFKPTSDPVDRHTLEEDLLFRRTFGGPAGMNAPFDITLYLQQIVDHGEYFELQPQRARNMVTAFGRLGGWVVGFVANNSAEASGQIDVDAAAKATRFIRFCNVYNIPLIFLEDTTGFLPGTEQERRGIILAGRKLLDAIIDIRTPRMTMIIRNAFGGAYAAYNSHFVGADLVFAMPMARVAVMGPGGGVEFVYKDEVRKLEGDYAAAVEAGRQGGPPPARRRTGGPHHPLRRHADEPEGGPVPRLGLEHRDARREPERAGPAPRLPDADLPGRPHGRRAAGARVVLTPDLEVVPFHEAGSEWLRSFTLHRVKCLVVCRGPVRKEAFEVFDQIGVGEYGMLLSEKDSVVYPRCLAPELRDLRFPGNVHRVEDYMGSGPEEKLARIQEIIGIAKRHGYTHLFAGYGFMAEDVDFIQAIEDAGLRFIGPSANTVRLAGAKDEAKKLARRLDNAVIPGVDNVSARALTRKAGDRKALEALAAKHTLTFGFRDEQSLEDNAEALLQAGYERSVELVTIAELQAEAATQSGEIWAQYPKSRIRFKAIGGGGGKGQRVVSGPGEVAAAVMGVIAEQKVTAPGSNRNFLIELNLEKTRHNEIQLLGNGEWCISLGGRDCSIQMHEQKQLEFSLNRELLDEAIAHARGEAAKVLKKDRDTLARMEADGERFGRGVGLDSVSTFECIVEGFDHFFMEMNTRIQVEHGVTELVYRLKFTNPDDPGEFFYVDRLIEAMVLVELHGARLPRPERVPRHVSGGEIRMNATNDALKPHAGGMIRSWSKPLSYEIRDDQGIGTRNPDTGSFVYYNLAGAYDSNIALILTDGSSPGRHPGAHVRDPAPDGPAREGSAHEPARAVRPHQLAAGRRADAEAGHGLPHALAGGGGRAAGARRATSTSRSRSPRWGRSRRTGTPGRSSPPRRRCCCVPSTACCGIRTGSRASSGATADGCGRSTRARSGSPTIRWSSCASSTTTSTWTSPSRSRPRR